MQKLKDSESSERPRKREPENLLPPLLQRLLLRKLHLRNCKRKRQDRKQSKLPREQLRKLQEKLSSPQNSPKRERSKLTRKPEKLSDKELRENGLHLSKKTLVQRNSTRDNISEPYGFASIHQSKRRMTSK